MKTFCGNSLKETYGMFVQNLQPLLWDYFLSLEQAARTAVFVGVTSGFLGVQLVTDGQVI
ncbi:MAG: hypothetical protein LAO31_06165 [Acidobacteriia bacterium]|nr:hypothetical protein [Terriglobia bacterium]